MNIQCPVSVGELLDKISILQIKLEKVTDSDKLAYIQDELSALLEVASVYLEDFHIWIDQLKTVNLKLWEIEDCIREKERMQDFGNQFIELARQVYLTNDERFCLKNAINKHYHSDLQEQKSYANYSISNSQ